MTNEGSRSMRKERKGLRKPRAPQIRRRMVRKRKQKTKGGRTQFPRGQNKNKKKRQKRFPTPILGQRQPALGRFQYSFHGRAKSGKPNGPAVQSGARAEIRLHTESLEYKKDCLPPPSSREQRVQRQRTSHSQCFF